MKTPHQILDEWYLEDLYEAWNEQALEEIDRYDELQETKTDDRPITSGQ